MLHALLPLIVYIAVNNRMKHPEQNQDSISSFLQFFPVSYRQADYKN